ncbi:MAG: hypothetical protein JW801_08790 [Bacteroidales bacterium]|nr:hypothetical protein [Bacteroidales bacterium]
MQYHFQPIRSVILLVGLLFMAVAVLHGQDLPLGYISYYSEDAATAAFPSSLERTAPDLWKVSKYKSTIIYHAGTDSLHPEVFPQNQGVIPNLLLGDYIMEFEFKLLDSCTNDCEGFFLLSPIKDCGNYYAFGFSSDSVTFYYPNTQNGSVRVAAKKHGVNLNEWIRVRVVRNMIKRTITFRIDGEDETELIFSDRRLVMGFVGFGTQNVNSAIRNVRIWAPTAFQDQIYTCQ